MTLAEAQQAIIGALEPLKTEIPDLQVYGYRNQNPTPPSLDVYPSDLFQVGAGMGVGEKMVLFMIRGRVSSADQETQKLLLRMLDPSDPASVEAALVGIAEIGNEGSVSGFQDDLDGLISCQWRVEVFIGD